jgi:pyruvate carboxylase
MGAHILAIKDMAGLCKPYAARLLVKTLKQEVGIPIHFHTHDTAGVQAGAILQAAEAGVDIADGAMAPLSGGTSQPNLNTLVEALRFTDRDPHVSTEALDAIAVYWRAVREFYAPFESPTLAAGADLYRHEMPGGQYTNLYEQSRALGLADRWDEVCRTYAEVNQLLGDIVKVTPTSKAVGDMALFLITKDLTCADVMDATRDIAFPQSVLDLLSGRMGQTVGGFPRQVRDRILRGEKPLRGRAGSQLPPADFDQSAEKLEPLLGRQPTRKEVLSHLLYPTVFEEFAAHQQNYTDTSNLPTPVYFFGMEPGEEITFELEAGKTLFVKFLTFSDPHDDGSRTVFFELNGQPRHVTVIDQALVGRSGRTKKADPNDDRQVGASMPGMVVTVAVRPGDQVAKGQKLLMLEAMKMQTNILAQRDGKVQEILVKPGSQVENGDLLLRLE